MNKEDWLLNLLKEMIKKHYYITDLNKIKIIRDKDNLLEFHFKLSINKSVFEDVLTEKEKSMLWLEGEDNE